MYRMLFKISQRITSMEAKIDDLQSSRYVTWMEARMDDIIERMDDIVAKVDGIANSVDDRIADQGMEISSTRRGMERLYELCKKEEEIIRNNGKRVENHEIMLRRILGFHQNLEELSVQQTQVGKGVQALINMAFPADDVKAGNSSTEEDDDDSGTQYDNDELYQDNLGTGPPPTLFPAPSQPPPLVPVSSSIAFIPPPITGPVPPSITGPVPLSTTGPVPPSITGPVPAPNPSPKQPPVTGAVQPIVAAPAVTPLARQLTPVPGQLPPAPEPTPVVTMTTPTPINSQDDDQATKLIASSSSLLPPPANSPPSADRLSPPSTTDETIPIPTKRRSPRIGGNSRAPSATPEPAAKRRSEDEKAGDPKRRKVMPS
jgi:hypothetical protein